MLRSYYANPISHFLQASNDEIMGVLSKSHNHDLEANQKNAWIEQIEILRDGLNAFKSYSGHIFFEFAIPRMGKRVDNILVIKDTVFVVEFKVGSSKHEKSAITQVIDYSLDLKNFHEGSHNVRLIPLLIATDAEDSSEELLDADLSNIEALHDVLKANRSNFAQLISKVLKHSTNDINPEDWSHSQYRPTPTIIEAAQALYQGHNVEDISRSDAGAINLSLTTQCLSNIIEDAKAKKKKAICFITGVPGAGKTLAGLNVASMRMKAHQDNNEHAVFLSGNGPLVAVLREALARDEVSRTHITKDQAKRKASAFIQNIHHFRDEYISCNNPPIENVVIFDEAQRAWTKEQVFKFMKNKRGIENFDMSEPAFLIDVMNRHKEWCVVIALIGGGQEINTGEAGLEEWIKAFYDKSKNDWDVYYSDLIVSNSIYLNDMDLKKWLINSAHCKSDTHLHLNVSVRSFRSEYLAAFVHSLLNIDIESAKKNYSTIRHSYPIVMTRDLDTAKTWLRKKAKGTERFGLVASSGAKRLRPLSIDVKNSIDPTNWFLNEDTDVRSSYYMEDVATEFDIQGLEIDWACLAWGADFHLKSDQWIHMKFSGTKWQFVHNGTDQKYTKNAYRVLLTRARQGMVIFIPNGNPLDFTRSNDYYDGTYDYFKKIGIQEI